MNNSTSSLEMLKSSKSVLILLFMTVFLGFLAFFGFSQSLIAYGDAEAVENEIVQMNSDMETWRGQIAKINSEKFHPIEGAKLENIQSDLMIKLKSLDLALSNFRQSTSTVPNTKAFDVSFTGSYNSTIKFLDDFQFGDALVTLSSVRMQSREGGLISTEIKYLVYIK